MLKYIQTKQNQKELEDSIRSIPKKNRMKFYCDLLKLIEFAKKDNYENFNLD